MLYFFVVYYEIRYKNTKSHSNKIFLSSDHDIFHLEQIETLPITREDIEKESLKNPAIHELYKSLECGSILPHGYDLGFL